MYRCKIDDSTGQINVTIWKEQIFQVPASSSSSSLVNQQNIETTLNDSIFGDNNSEENEEESAEVQNLFQSIKNRTYDSRFNNFLQNRPQTGDYLKIRGTIKTYKTSIEINGLSAIKLKTSAEEYIEMIMPIYLNDKCYKLIDSTKINSLRNTIGENKKEIDNKIIDEKLVDLVHSKLKYLTSNSNQPCSSFMLFNNIRDDKSLNIEFKSITNKDVLNALKQLELKSFIYSCDDEFTFLPIQ
jgi:hypothetical protein